MQFVDSFEVTKIGKAYVVKVNELHPKRKTMLFHVDSGASVTLVGLNSFCNKEDIGKRFYPEKVLDFNSILEDYKSRALG